MLVYDGLTFPDPFPKRIWHIAADATTFQFDIKPVGGWPSGRHKCEVTLGILLQTACICPDGSYTVIDETVVPRNPIPIAQHCAVVVLKNAPGPSPPNASCRCPLFERTRNIDQVFANIPRRFGQAGFLAVGVTSFFRVVRFDNDSPFTVQTANQVKMVGIGDFTRKIGKFVVFLQFCTGYST